MPNFFPTCFIKISIHLFLLFILLQYYFSVFLCHKAVPFLYRIFGLHMLVQFWLFSRYPLITCCQTNKWKPVKKRMHVLQQSGKYFVQAVMQDCKHFRLSHSLSNYTKTQCRRAIDCTQSLIGSNGPFVTGKVECRKIPFGWLHL